MTAGESPLSKGVDPASTDANGHEDSSEHAEEHEDEDEDEEEEGSIYEMVEVDEDTEPDAEPDQQLPPVNTIAKAQAASTSLPAQHQSRPQADEADSFENVSVGNTPVASVAKAQSEHPPASASLAAFSNLSFDEAASQVQGMAWEQLSKLGAAFGPSSDTPTGSADGPSGGSGIATFAKDLTSWWSNLDKPKPVPQSAVSDQGQLGRLNHAQGENLAIKDAPIVNEAPMVKEAIAIPNRTPGAQVSSAVAAGEQLQKEFGLPASENLVEQFKCKLLQTYACSHNSFTPAIQMAFAGTLSITDGHTCFTIEERGRKLPFKIMHADVIDSTHSTGTKKGPGQGVLRITAVNDVVVEFKDFSAAGDLDSALALIEHLVDSCKNRT